MTVTCWASSNGIHSPETRPESHTLRRRWLGSELGSFPGASARAEVQTRGCVWFGSWVCSVAQRLPDSSFSPVKVLWPVTRVSLEESSQLESAASF